MQNKEFDMIINILGILGMIFCLIALIAPWGDGVYTYGVFQIGYSAPFYIDLFTNSMYDSFKVQVIFIAILMIIIFILMLYRVLLNIFTIKNIQDYQPYKFFNLGIFLLVPFILYMIVVASAGSVNYYSTENMYSIGFFMSLIAAIIYFIAYGIKKYALTTPSPIMNQQPVSSKIKTKAKFCSQCGIQLQPNVNFCPECGYKQ